MKRLLACKLFVLAIGGASISLPGFAQSNISEATSLRLNHIAMGGVYRIETSTNAQVAEPLLGLSLAFGRRFTVFDLSLEYQEIWREESGNQLLSLGSRDRDILTFVEYPLQVFTSESFRTSVGLGSGVSLSTARTRFQSVITESSSQAELLFKVGFSLKYLIDNFLVGLDGRLHYSRGTSDRFAPEMLLRFGSRF